MISQNNQGYHGIRRVSWRSTGHPLTRTMKKHGSRPDQEGMEQAINKFLRTWPSGPYFHSCPSLHKGQLAPCLGWCIGGWFSPSTGRRTGQYVNPVGVVPVPTRSGPQVTNPGYSGLSHFFGESIVTSLVNHWYQKLSLVLGYPETYETYTGTPGYSGISLLAQRVVFPDVHDGDGGAVQQHADILALQVPADHGALDGRGGVYGVVGVGDRDDLPSPPVHGAADTNVPPDTNRQGQLLVHRMDQHVIDGRHINLRVHRAHRKWSEANKCFRSCDENSGFSQDLIFVEVTDWDDQFVSGLVRDNGLSRFEIDAVRFVSFSTWNFDRYILWIGTVILSLILRI